MEENFRSQVASASKTAAREGGGNGKPGTEVGTSRPVIRYPDARTIEIRWTRFLSDLEDDRAARLFEGLFSHPAVRSVALDPRHATATMRFADGSDTRQHMPAVARSLSQAASAGPGVKNGFHHLLPLALATTPSKVLRYGQTFSTWEVRHALPGRIRFYNPIIHRKKDLCDAVEGVLVGIAGVNKYSSNPLTSTVLIHFDPAQVTPQYLAKVLDAALLKAKHPEASDSYDKDFAVCSTTLAVAAVGQFAVPALAPVGSAMLLYASIPSYKGAYNVAFKEKRAGVDILDAVVISMCLLGGEIVAGAFMCWCLGLGRKLLKKTQDTSRKMLLDVFGKQPRFVWVLRDGVEVELPLEDLRVDDIVAVKTGEVIPVDGFVCEGFCMVDQHILTGESAPVEKGLGDRVYASTVMVAGKINICVEKTGSETTSAQIGRILNETLDYKLKSQTRGEALADRAVIPTISLGALAGASLGMGGAMAVINCDLGTGIRIAAPLGMLTSLNLCAQHGILVKDGRALEGLTRIDTILFDKTGTLTRERPEVGRILTFHGFEPNTIIQYAAAAEYKFTHPIARAIQEKFAELNLPLPETDDSKYHVGFGITVAVEGHTVRVGSARFLERESIPVPESLQSELAEIHAMGNSAILLAVDDRLAGAMELQASHRPEVKDVIDGLRKRGVRQMVIISGDHEAPTKRMAEMLGMDRYFAGVLPQDKAKYVELLQKEGRTVCFVGDGINDTIALKKADVSISLRGASSIATDTAQVVFMQESLGNLCNLLDIARGMDSNVKRSWKLIVVPNSFCVAGVFTLGFGLWYSVLFNNVTILASLVNGLLPLRKAAEIKAEKELALEMALHGSGKNI